MDKIISKIELRIKDNKKFLLDKNIPLSNRERTALKMDSAFLNEIKTDLEKYDGKRRENKKN